MCQIEIFFEKVYQLSLECQFNASTFGKDDPRTKQSEAFYEFLMQFIYCAGWYDDYLFFKIKRSFSLPFLLNCIKTYRLKMNGNEGINNG